MMTDQFSIINAILGFLAALAGLYVFVKLIFNGERKPAIVAMALLLAVVSAGVFIYKPIVPSTSITAVTENESQEILDDNTVKQEYIVDLINDIHRGFSASTRTFNKIYEAKPGYKIVDSEWDQVSRNNVESKSIVISDDGSSVRLTSVIEAGPVFDRWRGWLKGRIITTQVKM